MNYIVRRQSIAGLLILLTGFLLLLAGCGGGSGGGGSTPILKAILINPPSATVSPGDTGQFTATGYDQNGKTMSINPTWSVTGDIGTVAPETGATTTFTATNTGNGTIVATVGDISRSATITVSAELPVLTTIEIEPDEITFQVNTSQEFTATGYDQFGNVLTINPTWSGTGVAGTFSATGSTVSFTPTATGSGTITASEGYVWGTANIVITEAAPTTIRVGVDKDYATIQAAIDAATDGATIIVDEGTYTENLNILDKSITLKSTNPDSSSVMANTIINGGGSEAVLWVRVQSDYQEHAVNIEGLTITGGSMGVSVNNSNWSSELSVSLKKNIISSNISPSFGSSGGGVYGTGSNVQLTLEGNTIENNSVERKGGGICLMGDSSNKMQVTMTDNTIRDNSADDQYGAGGGIYASNVEGTWSGNMIDGNSAVINGGGIYLYDSSPIIIDNDIINNEVISDAINLRGGGIFIVKSEFGECNPTIQNNRIGANCVLDSGGSVSGSGGGLYIESASGLTLTGNTISANRAYHGAGIFISADTATLTNNEISDNVANTGGGLYANGSVGISGNQFIGNTATGDGGGVFVSGIGELTGSGNIFNNNAKYAIYLSYGGTWTDEDGNTFSGNTPDDVYNPK